MPNSQDLTYTAHARLAMSEREISADWIERVVASPGLRLYDPNDVEVERFYGSIAEMDGRVLRVAVNTRVVPWRVVNVFFDRRMRGRL